MEAVPNIRHLLMKVVPVTIHVLMKAVSVTIHLLMEAVSDQVNPSKCFITCYSMLTTVILHHVGMHVLYREELGNTGYVDTARWLADMQVKTNMFDEI
jgi:hypothetical protein